MDFDKIKPAVEQITLSESMKADILKTCAEKKQKKFNYKPLIAAAIIMILLIPALPTLFLIGGSKSADSSPQENMNYADSIDEKALGSIGLAAPVFEADGFRKIYGMIPTEFILLVDGNAFEEWQSEVSAEGGMAIVQFVEYFSISPQTFEQANKEYSEKLFQLYSEIPLTLPADYQAQENLEIFNSEIIFSFDREKTDAYYRRSSYPFRDKDSFLLSGADSLSQTAAEEYYQQ